ncbi:MAG: DUF1993 domain-containing protein [Pseudomonadota bacterium]|nr:DUF1993 domain-containing protein [Pseudomonadota bacterium]
MSISIYEVCVPPMIHMLDSLSKILDKAVEQAKERDIPLSALLEARLAPDMHPLTRQIQIASDAAKGCAARLTGIEAPSFADTEASFPELQARIAKTIAFLKSVKPEQFEGGETRQVTLKLPQRTLEFTGLDFLRQVAQPNFYFHVTTAYALLRHNGIQIGKADYLGGV